jgi:importin-5
VACAALILMIVTRPTLLIDQKALLPTPWTLGPASLHGTTLQCPRPAPGSIRRDSPSPPSSALPTPACPWPRRFRAPKIPPSSLAKPPQNQKIHSETRPKPKKVPRGPSNPSGGQEVPMDPQADAAAVLGADPAALTALLVDLTSPANEARSQAERQFHALRSSHPDALALSLAQLLLSPAHPSAPIAAVLLRRLIAPSSQSFVYPALSPASQSSLRALLLSAASAPALPRSVSKKLSDAVAELASFLLPSNAWPDLLTFLYKSIASPSSPPPLLESALNILARLASHLAAGFPNLHALLLSALSHPSSADVRVAGLNAAISLIQSLPSSADRDQFQDLLPAMMHALAESLNSGNEGSAQEALEMMIELAGAEPRFLRRQLLDVVASMLQIAEAPGLEDGTRHLAVEFVVTLAEARDRAPGMMRKLPRYVGRLFAVLMTMLLDVHDEPAWHAAVQEEEDAGETGSYVFAQECLDRLAIAVGGNTILPVAAELLPSFFSSEEWKRRHAALVTIAQIAEGSAKVMIKNLEQVVGMVLNSFQDPHPRVRWAAINAVGQLSTDLGPEVQNQLHHVVLPALASAMDDFHNPRVQASYFRSCTAPHLKLHCLFFIS